MPLNRDYVWRVTEDGIVQVSMEDWQSPGDKDKPDSDSDDEDKGSGVCK